MKSAAGRAIALPARPRLPEPPHAQAISVELSERELDELLDGIELSEKSPSRAKRE